MGNKFLMKVSIVAIAMSLVTFAVFSLDDATRLLLAVLSLGVLAFVAWEA